MDKLFGSFFAILFKKSYHVDIPNFEIIKLHRIATIRIETPIMYKRSIYQPKIVN